MTEFDKRSIAYVMSQIEAQIDNLRSSSTSTHTDLERELEFFPGMADMASPEEWHDAMKLLRLIVMQNTLRMATLENRISAFVDEVNAKLDSKFAELFSIIEALASDEEQEDDPS